MLYRRYKEHFVDCETLRDYNASTKSITVLVPDERMKPSGTRGKSYHWLRFSGIERATGRTVNITIKAIDRNHAIAQLPDDCDWIFD